MGRKPKPTALKLLQGNPGGRPINKYEPKPEPSIPTCPDELCDDAKLEWNRLAPYLLRVGMMTEADRGAFAGYCQAFGRWIDAERMLKIEGEILTSDKNNLVQNPRLWVANRALEQMYKFMSEFGLSPSSRSRLKINPPVEDEMEGYLDRGKKLRQG
jgi:P27 family predicted phage terminase small subunit